jgi:hypothetical protein
VNKGHERDFREERKLRFRPPSQILILLLNNETTTEQKHLKAKIQSTDHGKSKERIARRSWVDTTAAIALTRR